MADEQLQPVPAPEEMAVPDAAPDSGASDISEATERPTPIVYKALFLVFTIILIAVGLYFSTRLASDVNKLQTTASPTPTEEVLAVERYYNPRFGIAFEIPQGWIQETLAASGGPDFVALRPSSVSGPCFISFADCPIVMEFRDNPENFAPDKFGQPFYPPADSIRGGADLNARIGGQAAVVLYNIDATGGRIVYFQPPGHIFKIVLRDASVVPLETVSVFDKILQEITIDSQ